MFHRTQNLLLRPAWPEDWQMVHAGIADHGVVRNLARAPWPYQPSDARSFVECMCEPMFPRFLVTRTRDAALVGCIGIDRKGDDGELGYWIARQHWGRGYATEAGRALLEISAMLGHQRLVASHFLDNPASGRVLRKLGFEPTGRVTARYSCGRGEEAPAAEYALELDQALAGIMRAA
ncbi:MAG: GNAT family N-acetyltransferase [Erythrobacter sp.]|nr:GNAT family N-acetyltransferase [Erythrobacter sp.]